MPDIQGSIVASLDAASGALTKAGFQPFGETPSTAGTFRYTGARIDAETNGLYDFRARMYSPVLGRFLQVDRAGTVGGVNLYAYVGNDPLNLLDILGLAAEALQGVFPGAGFPTEGVAESDAIFAVLVGPAGAARALGSAVVTGIVGQLSPTEGGAVVQTSVPSVQTGSSPAEQLAAAGITSNIANGPRLAQQLSFESASSPFTASGGLTQEAINSSSQIFAPGELNNPAIPQGVGKYTTPTFQSPSGDFQAHFYINPTTMEPYYGLDYKSQFNAYKPFGAP